MASWIIARANSDTIEVIDAARQRERKEEGQRHRQGQRLAMATVKEATLTAMQPKSGMTTPAVTK